MAAIIKDFEGFVANLSEHEKQIYPIGADGKRQVRIFTCPILETEDKTIQNAFSLISATFENIFSSWDIITYNDHIQLVPSSFCHFIKED